MPLSRHAAASHPPSQLNCSTSNGAISCFASRSVPAIFDATVAIRDTVCSTLESGATRKLTV